VLLSHLHGYTVQGHSPQPSLPRAPCLIRHWLPYVVRPSAPLGFTTVGTYRTDYPSVPSAVLSYGYWLCTFSCSFVSHLGQCYSQTSHPPASNITRLPQFLPTANPPARVSVTRLGYNVIPSVRCCSIL